MNIRYQSRLDVVSVLSIQGIDYKQKKEEPLVSLFEVSVLSIQGIDYKHGKKKFPTKSRISKVSVLSIQGIDYKQ